MIFAYLRVSTDKQSVENQRFELLKYTDSKKLQIDLWIEETISSTKSIQDRKLGQTIELMKENDLLIVSELSRLGRNLMEVMSVLHNCMEKNIKVITIKEGYELGDNINSKILAFAFSLSAEIERKLIAQRTKEALARKKAEGMKLGRPKGSQNKVLKLSGKEENIKILLEKKVGLSAIARILDVNRLTLAQFIISRHLK
jgi:putative DNA-invertase from lambdoid prophage Rac